MKKLLLALSLFSPFAFGQSDLFLRSRGLDTDLQLCVNDGGVEGCPIVIDGATKTIIASGSLLAGGQSIHRSLGGSLSHIQIDNGTNTQGLSVVRTTDNAFGGANYFGKSRGTGASPTLVANGDNIGGTIFTAHDGSDFGSIVADISVEIDGVPGGNDTPGRIVFRTTPDGASTTSEAMRIQSDQTTVLTVQDDGAAAAGLCPDGGTVCSGQVTGATYPCANAVNMDCLINTISWVRVGGIVTATLTAKGTRTGSVGSSGSFTINAPGNVGAFLNDDGSGPCAWGGGGVSHVPGTITANAGGTILIFEALPVNPSALQVSLDCTFQYHVR